MTKYIPHVLKLPLWKPWACEMHSTEGMCGCINQLAPQLPRVLDSEPFLTWVMLTDSNCC